MHSKLISVTVVLTTLAVALAEPPSVAYGPPGYQAPSIISSAPRTIPVSRPVNPIVVSSGSSSPSSILTSLPKVSTPIRTINTVSNYNNQRDQEGGEPEPFNYAYEVKDSPSGNDFGAVATSDGKRVQGEYRVLLPDGRRQVVKYVADDGGYNADVQYEGQARYPDPATQTQYRPAVSTNAINTVSNAPINVAQSPIVVSSAPSVRTSSPISVSSPGRTSSFSGYRY